MDFNLSAEDRELVDLVDRVASEKFRVNAFSIKEGHGRPAENMRLLGELGILGLCMPIEDGGSARPILSGILAIEHISRACPRTGSAALFVIAGPPLFIAKWGTEQQRRKYLPDVISGRKAFSISLTEPEAGTALTDLRTSAVIEGEHCVINGQKTFCSNANLNDHILLFCRFAPGADGIGAVILDRDTPGLTLSTPHEHLNGTPWCELFLDNARVPVGNVLFTTGGFRRLMSSYCLERTATGALVLGAAQIAFDMAKEYAASRRQFGRPIAEFQMVQARLADMYLRLEQARLLLYRSVQTGDMGEGKLQSSAAKIASTEAAIFVTDQAMQVFGGAGMSKELPLEWLYRFVRPYTVAGGTSDIHRSMIASELVNMRFDHRPGRQAMRERHTA